MRERRSSTEKSSLAGSLLLAHPELRDPNFRKTVILMTSDTMGVVLNRPLGKSLGAVGKDFALSPLATVPLFVGGPVERKQLIIAAWQSQPHGFQLHLGIEPEKAMELLKEEDTHVRAFFGYAGWSPGQLKNELKLNTWLIADAPRDLFDHPGDVSLWRTTVANEGEQWRLLANEPDHPERN